MQKENVSYDALITTSAADKSAVSTAAPPRFSRSNPFLAPTSPTYVNSNASSSLYSSLFQNYSSSSPSETASFDGGETDRRLHEASCILEYQQLYNRYTLCLAQLHDSMEEVDALRRENDTLRVSNADLSRRVSLLFSRDRLLAEFNRLSIASSSAAAAAATATASRDAGHLAATAQPFAEHNLVERSNGRVPLPKSISVRSSGYLKTPRHGHEMTARKGVNQPSPASQRVYVPGSTKEEEQALELDVYNQGMTKTELCNKWQETGACPYGENCQFAHGIKELRPVIRHPRYKTEVCRIVLAGDICPYGHRCHFRHSLTDQERLVAAPSPR